MSKATIFLKDDEWFEVETPHPNKQLVSAFKKFNSKDRYWSPEDKRWGFRMEHLNSIIYLLRLILSIEPDIIQGVPDPLRDQAKIMKEFIRDVKLEIINPEEIRL